MFKHSMQVLTAAALGVALISCSSGSSKGPQPQPVIRGGTISGPVGFTQPSNDGALGGRWMCRASQMLCLCRIMAALKLHLIL